MGRNHFLPIMFLQRISNLNQLSKLLTLNETAHINVINILRYSIPVVSFIADCILELTVLYKLSFCRFSCNLNTCCD